MPTKRLKEYLDVHGVKYTSISHSPAVTAQTTAAVTHISGKELAKTVLFKVDGKLVMVVLPASERVNLGILMKICRARDIELADEIDFSSKFPDCEVGAMPPFGNLYGIDVFVSTTLTNEEEIAFNAGSHREVIKIAYKDFERLVNPRVGYLSGVLASHYKDN